MRSQRVSRDNPGKSVFSGNWLLALLLALPLGLLGVAPAFSTPGQVLSDRKISDTEGGFTGVLDDQNAFGFSVAALGDVDGDGIGDLAVGAFPDDDGGPYRGAVFLLFLDSDGSVKAHQKISDTQGGFSGGLDDQDVFGMSVTALGDLDGDGVRDLAVGATRDDDGGASSSADRGAVWVLFLHSDGSVKAHQKISDTQGGFSGVLDDGDYFGSSVATLGDLDGDGVGDLAVGAYGDDDGGFQRGAVWVLFLDTDGTVKAHQKISDTQGGFTGVLNRSDWFGVAAAALGDLDGDGVRELAVGASLDDDGGAGRGAVWLLFLDTDGTVKAHRKISDTRGGFGGVLDDMDRFGSSFANLGDLDGDGVADLAVGAFYDDGGGVGRGAVWLLFLDTDGTVVTHQKISDSRGGFGSVLDDEDYFGISLAALGDFDGDDVGNLAVGAFYDDDGGANRGAVWLLALDGAPIVFGNDVRVTPPVQATPQGIAALAAAVDADPTRAAPATTATTAVASGYALVTNGTVDAVTIADPGLAPVGVPVLHPVLQWALALLLMRVGAVALRRRSPASPVRPT